MKLFAMLIMASSLVFVACNDDDENKENYIMYGGNEDVLEYGLIEYYGQWDGTGYNFDITLLSSKSAYDAETGLISGVYFEMFSNSNTALTDGTYNYDATMTEDPFTFDEGEFVINYDMAAETGTEDEFTSGTVTIKKSGATYTIDFEGLSPDGKKIEGNYTGTLVYEDYSKKSALVKNKLFNK